MHPSGFFTPTLGSTSVDSIEERPDVFATIPQRPRTPNFTAPEQFLRRPPFLDSQSEPIISRKRETQTSIPTFFTPTQARRGARATERRRGSNPPQTRPRNGFQIDNSAIRKRMQQRTVSTPARLISSPSHLPNEPTPIRSHIEPRKPRAIDIDIHQKLLEPLTPGDQEGFVYVIQDPAREHLGVKIGFTTCRNYETRLDQHARACGFKPKELYVTQPLTYCKRTEVLVHLDLKDLCQHWECNTKACKSKPHTEWFQVDEKLAVETVKQWEAFMNVQRPYDFRKKLGPLWTYLLGQRRHVQSITNNIDHDARRKIWTSTLSAPSYSDYISFSHHTLGELSLALLTTWLSIEPYVTQFFWQTVTVIYSFTTLVAFRNTFSFCAFAAVLVCACFSVLPQLKKFRSTRKPRAKSP